MCAYCTLPQKSSFVITIYNLSTPSKALVGVSSSLFLPNLYLIAHIGVFVADGVQNHKSKEEEESSEQVAEGRQVWNRRVVRVHVSRPHPVNEPVRSVQQSPQLNNGGRKVDSQEY